MAFPKLSKPGPTRPAVVLTLVGVAAAISLLLALHEDGDPIETAVVIGGVSLVLFSAVALFTSDCVRVWHCVDYAWVATTFVTVIVALSNISETNRLRSLADAKL